MHSKLYLDWVSLEKTPDENIINFCSRKKSIACFTYQDIISLVQNEDYKLLFERLVLARQAEELLYLLPDLAIVPFFQMVGEEAQRAMISALMKSFLSCKAILLQLPLSDKHWEVLAKEFCDLVIHGSISIFKNIINSKEILELILKCFPYVNCRDAYPFLQKIKLSPFFEELYPFYKENIYWGFLMKVHMKEDFKDKYLELPMILEDLCRIEKMELYDVTCCETKGFFSEVYFFRNLLLKIGYEKTSFLLPNSENLMYPMKRLIRPELDLYLEVTAIADTENITEEDVYAVYKKERMAGRVWGDAKKENLGRLRKRNNSYDFYVDPRAVGLNGENKKWLGPNEFVIIDLDYFCDEKNAPSWFCWEETLEERYQQELALEKKKGTSYE